MTIIIGAVIEGDRRGRHLGFPTINLDAHDLPAEISDGVYSGLVLLTDDRRFNAAISIGIRPTFHSSTDVRLVEAFILDFNEDLYGAKVHIVLGDYLRPQLSFANEADLIDQMREDVAWIRGHSVSMRFDGCAPDEENIVELNATSDGT